MAQAVIQPDSPLDDYLTQAALETNQLTTTTTTTTTPSVTIRTTAATTRMEADEAQLSERIKYLICSSFLLNPNLEPAFYNSHSPVPAEEIHSFPTENTHPTNQNHIPWRILSSPIALLLLILIPYYHLSLVSFLLSSIPILLLSLAFLFNHSRSVSITPSTEPTLRETQFRIQSELIPQVTHLVNASQALDLRLSRAIGAVKEIECVALGFGLSNPMPPITRLENSAFAFSSLSSPSGANFPHRDQQNTLHALGVRKVLQRVLDQLRHDFESTAVELEAVIVNPALNPSEESPSSSSSTLSALMEMYGCPRGQTALETQTSRKNTAAQRARRQAWRASLHSNNQETLAFSPNMSPNHLYLNSSSPSSSPRRLSWQTPPPVSRSISETYHPAHLDVGKRSSMSLQQARSCSNLLGTPPQPPPPSEHGSRKLQSSSHEDSHHHIRSRPLSTHLAAPASPSVLDTQLFNTSSRSSRPRPVSMYAASPYAPNASTLLGARKLVEPYPNILLEPPNHPESVTRTEEPPTTERVIPYSLNALLNSFDSMNVSRKRLMCCLLALDFTLFVPPTSVNMWQDTLDAVAGLLKTVEDLSTELTNGMTSEFGPGSFEHSSPTVGRSDDPSLPSDTFTDHHHQHSQEEKAKNEVRDFGPPVGEAEKKAKRLESLSSQMGVMDRALRTITAKMKVCMEELEKETAGDEDHGRRAISIHESIRVDLETLAREWDESRTKIRTVVEGERVLVPGKNRLLRNSLDSNEGSSSFSHASSSIYSSELLTPVSEDDSMGIFQSSPTGPPTTEEINREGDNHDHEEFLSTLRSHHPIVPPPGLEEILKGVVVFNTSTRHNRTTTTTTTHNIREENGLLSNQPSSSTIKPRRSLKLTPEEQIELKKKRTESFPLTPRSQARSRPLSLLTPSSHSTTCSDSCSSSSVGSFGLIDFDHSTTAGSGINPTVVAHDNAPVVNELKDVLSALKSKRLSHILT